MKPHRRRALRRQQIVRVQAERIDALKQRVDAGHGVLITPNHSFHWDSYCLSEAADELRMPFYIMSAWQVFALSSPFERFSMQSCGCFSVDREGTDVAALKTSVDILQNRPQPLVIFPEGDVYHLNDRVTPFRDGAAAIALMAARKSERPISVVPVAIKRWYIDDPTVSLQATIEKLESRLFWRPQVGMPLPERILSVAQGLLALKEIEFMKRTQSGTLAERIENLTSFVLEEIETRCGIKNVQSLIPERVKEVRRSIIAAREATGDQASPTQHAQWNADMDAMFFVTQLYSYPGDYLLEDPTIERIAETLDKLEEDALGATYPTVHGRREVLVRFGEPIDLPLGKEKRVTPAEITDQMESQVQAMLDDMNLRRQTRG